jgi:hypothetical protein
MDIVKAFNTNDLHTEIIIKGTIDEPLFRASDIGVVLELSNIRATIVDFDESEKVVNKVDTLGGNQEVTFLTEKGLYRGTKFPLLPLLNILLTRQGVKSENMSVYNNAKVTSSIKKKNNKR